MKKAPPVSLSLRKILIATLAVGPIAILPSPLLAALPTTITLDRTVSTPNTIIQTNGALGNLVSGSGLATITVPDRAVLVWTAGSFNIASGEEYRFEVGGGSVLNKIGYNATTGALAGADDAIINGTLRAPNGRVFVLANGNITVGGAARISTQGGLILSTQQETNDFAFTSGANLSFNGTSLGNITLGNGTARMEVQNGSLSAWAGTVTVNNISVSGDLILNSSGAGNALSLTGSGGNTSVTGNVSATTNNGAIDQAVTPLLVSSGTTTLNTRGNSAITLATATNDFRSVTLNAGTGSGGAVTIADSNDIIVNNSTVGGLLQINAGTSISTNGTVNAIGGTNLTSSGVGNITYGNNSTIGSAGTFSANAANGSVTVNAVGNVAVGTVIAGGSGPISILTNGVANLTSGLITLANVTVNAASINSTGSGTIGNGTVTANTVTVTGTGNVVLPGVVANRIVATTTGGSISQAATTALSLATANGNSSFDAGSFGNVTINAPTNTLSNQTLTLVGRDIAVAATSNVVLGLTNATGNVSVNTSSTTTANTGVVTVGSGGGTAVQGVSIGGNLAITTNASNVIADNDAPQNVFGSVTINTAAGTATGASVTYNTAWASPIGTTGRFGQVNINAGTAGNIVISETSTLNLGNLTGNTIVANSTTGDVIISGQINANTTFGGNAAAGNTSLWVRATGNQITQAAGGNLNIGTGRFESANTGGTSLTSNSNSFGGQINIVNGGNNVIVGSSNITFNPGNVTAGSVSVTTVGGTNNLVTLAGGNMTNVTINSAGKVQLNGGTIRNITITAGDSSATAITQNGNITVNGTMTLTTPGNVSLSTNLAASPTSNDITGTVVLANVVGDSSISSFRNLTVSGNSSGNVTLIAGTNGGSGFANAWNVFLGNLNVKSLSATAKNGGSAAGAADPFFGTSGTISQLAGTSVHVENSATFVTHNNSINLTNNSNSFGRVGAWTGGFVNAAAGLGNVSITEDGTLRLGNVSTNGSANLSSRFGSVIEDNAANNQYIVGGSLNVSTPNGNILLGNATHLDPLTTSTQANILAANLTASGTAQIITSNNLVLGNTAANSLTVTANTISQNAPLNVFGITTLNGANGITLTDAANNFGPISINVTNVNSSIAITEANTLNLRTVAMSAGGNGTFTAISGTGDIIDSGFGGVKLGGNSIGPGNGVVRLIAANGNISITNPTSDFMTTSGVVFNGNNVNLSVLGSNTSTLVLGAAGIPSAATGNLTVSSALGSITSAGGFTAGGLASFQANNPGAGFINLTSPGIGFGVLRFFGQQVTITEGGNMDIATNSTSFGPAVLKSTSGSISIVNVGGGLVTFGNTVRFEATGSVTLPKLIQSVGLVSVSHAGTADLSALSIGGDLAGITPQDLGTGTYVPPQP